MIEFLPGRAADDQTLATLKQIATEIANARNDQQAEQSLLRWAIDSERVMRFLAPPSEIDRLIHTPRCRAISADPTGSARRLAYAEIDDAVHRWEVELSALQTERSAWQRLGHLVGVDSNGLLHFGYPVADSDWRRTAGLAPTDEITLILTMTVVDEIDKLKRTGNHDTQVRARDVIRTLAKLFVGRVESPAVVEVAPGVRISVVADPPPP